ncbi:hypothetical protein Tco_0223082 [Tanacetum coccineum]
MLTMRELLSLEKTNMSSIHHHDSANTTHNHTVDHDESFGESRGHGETVETHPADETRLTESPVPARNHEKTDCFKTLRSCRWRCVHPVPGSVYVPEWTIHRRSRVDTLEECKELLTHLAPPVVREEMNAYDNNTSMERAWFSIARGPWPKLMLSFDLKLFMMPI